MRQARSPGIRRPLGTQRGLSLVELMVAMVLGLLITMAAAAVYLSSRASYNTIDDTTALDEKGRFALDTIVRIVRQAAWSNYAGNSAPPAGAASGPTAQAPGGGMVTTTSLSPTISGLDNCASPGQDGSLNLTCRNTSNPVNKSDVLQVRFFGSGTPANRTVPDNSMIDCSGNGVAEPQAWEDADLARGFARFYLAPDPADPTGLPQLMCDFRPRDAAGNEQTTAAVLNTVPMVSGVEVFQVLYGVDTNSDLIPDRYLSATEVQTLPTRWQTVVAAKISMVLVGDTASAASSQPPTFELFGPLYAGDGVANDARYTPSTQLQRMRRQYAVTVQLRNVATCMTCAPT
jgi:type IV pilus assembly protein PilW